MILAAAFVWGVGNAVTALTAQKYLASGSLIPAGEIALANTVGGLVFVGLAFLTSFLFRRRMQAPGSEFRRIDQKWVLSGALKGSNTCLFVFSATYIPATKSLIFESTYIFWSLLLGIILLSRRFPLGNTFVKAALLFIGVILVSNNTSLLFSSKNDLFGALFGVSAGLTYSFFLLFWSRVSGVIVGLPSQLLATFIMLAISSLTILLLTEFLSAISLGHGWVPFTALAYRDLLVQVVNGSFVVGVVYLLVTIGMGALRDAQEGSSVITALCLSFSIPFTLLPEMVFGTFVPRIQQVFGIVLFMVGFVLMSTSLSKAERASSLNGTKH